MSDPELYYRFEDRLESSGGFDMWGEWEPGPSHPVIHLNTFPVLRHTPKGVWIRDHGGDRRFICNSWTKRYALPSIEEAKHSFIKRKERQAGIYEARARTARQVLNFINADKYRGSPPWLKSSLT